MKKTNLFILICLLSFSLNIVNATDYVIKPNTIINSAAPISYYDALGGFICSDNGGYTESPALAVKAVTNGTLSMSSDYTTNSPTCKYDEYMRPFWSADTVYNETVLLLNPRYTNTDTIATGKLMYNPKKIISIKSFDGSVTYTEGVDYSISGNVITKLKGSSMISLLVNKVDNSIQSNQYIKNGRYSGLIYKQSKWICVTYMPDRSNWQGPHFGYKGNLLPKTMAKLKSKQPLKIVAHGMSITRGLNVSGYAEDANACPPVAPYMHSYIDLMNYRLKKIFGYDNIVSINAALPGANASWLASTAATHVSPLKPDLVILDMGMNDIWTCKDNYASFAGYIQSAMNTIKKDNPDVEFILLGGMMIDKNYSIDWDGVTIGTIIPNLYGYQNELKKMEADGIANLDMTTMSDSIYERKSQYPCYGAKSVTVNEMHPNDFLARCFAQGLVALLDSTTITAINTPIAENNDLMEVVPNPVVNGHVMLQLDENVITQGVIISIYDLSGKQVKTLIQNIKSKDYQATDLNLTKGIYIFEAKVGNKKSTKKVIID
jgi:Secretion system C-terminal sorting domain